MVEPQQGSYEVLLVAFEGTVVLEVGYFHRPMYRHWTAFANAQKPY